MGNGARAQQKRERKGKDAGKGTAKSQLKSNAAACEFKCDICKHVFLKTANRTLLTEHASNKHPGVAAERCFENFPEETDKEKAKRLAAEAELEKKKEEEEKKRLVKELLAKQKEEEAKKKAEEEEARKKVEEEEAAAEEEGADATGDAADSDDTKEVTDGVAKLDVDGKDGEDKKD